MSTSPQDRIEAFRTRSFLIVPAFLDDSECVALRRLCDGALDVARSTSRETGHSTPRISLLADAHPAVVERIGRLFSSPRACALLEGLALAGEPFAPMLRDVHYYHEQTQHDWDGDWHRDSQFGRPDPEMERVRIATTTTLHLRVALEPDACFEIVPGSHARWDTPDELLIRKGAHRATGQMPNAVRVDLRARDACIFHAWSVHRAIYRREPLRRTLDAVYAFGHPTSAFSPGA